MLFGWYALLNELTVGKTRFLMVSIPYLAVLPFVGALGGCASRRMRGSVAQRILSTLFPVFVFFALFGARIVYGLFFEGTPYTWAHFQDGLSVLLPFFVL